MLEAARRRTATWDNVDLRHGELEHLPVEDRALDAATLILVLHHLPDPGLVLEEVRRKLRPGGKLLIVDLLQHEKHEYREQMGHVWLGFAEEQILRFSRLAGLRSMRFRMLPVDPAARGPGLFAATAVAPSD
jgi:ArsR family transcriptional regulator